MPGLEKIIE